MRQPRYEVSRREKGFTLVELLIVIVILGVLAAVVVLALGAFDQRGERAACETDVKAVEVAVEAFLANEGRYPETLDELTAQPATYLRQLPNTNPGGGEYWITYDESTGQVAGQLGDGSVCAGNLLAAPDPSSTETTGGTPTTPAGTGTTSTQAGGGGTGTTPAGGGTTTQAGGGETSTTPAGGGETSTTPAGGGGTSTTPASGGTTTTGGSTTTTPTGGGTTTSTNPNPGPTLGAPVAAVNCLNPPGIDPWDCVASWSVPNGSLTGYEWQFAPRRGLACGDDDFPRWWPAFDITQTSFRIDLLFRGSYCFRVRAENGRIDGPWSQVVPFSWP